MAEWIEHEYKCKCGQVHRMEIRWDGDRLTGAAIADSARMNFIRPRRRGMSRAMRCWECRRRIEITKFKPV